MMGRALGLWAGRPWDCGLSGATRFVLDIITLGWGGDNQMEAAASLPPAVLLLVVLIQG